MEPLPVCSMPQKSIRLIDVGSIYSYLFSLTGFEWLLKPVTELLTHSYVPLSDASSGHPSANIVLSRVSRSTFSSELQSFSFL